jgi:pimeloyl-ACP methyl ester carboxylesterase
VTTIDEQADDAAALDRLHLEQAIVLGTSAAAGIVASLALRHPAVSRGAVFHEPIFPSGVTSPPRTERGAGT